LVVASLSGFEDPCKTSLSVLGVQVGCCPFLGLKIPAKLHFLFLLILVLASHFVSVLLSFIDLSSSPLLPSSRYPFFAVPSSRVFRSLVSSSFYRVFVVFLVVFLRTYPIPSVCFKFSAISDIASVSSFVSVLVRFLLILILPFAFYSFVLWDTHSSAPASVSPLSYFFTFRLFRPSSSISPLLDYSRYRPSSSVSSPCRYQSRPSSFLPHLSSCPRRLEYPLFVSRLLCSLFSVLWFNPLRFQLSLSSSVSAFVSILANRLARLNPSSFYPPSFLRSARPLPPIHHFLSIGYRLHLHLCLCQCLRGFAIVFPILRQIPVVIRSPDLWLPFGFSVVLSRLPSPLLFCFLSHPLSGATWIPLSITVYSYLSISLFAFDIRCPCSPTCFFVPSSLGLFYRRSPLHLSYPSTSIDLGSPLSIAAPTVLQSL